MTTIDDAHARLLEALQASRGKDASHEEAQTLHFAREAVVSVWPMLPGLIEERLGEADARILTQEQMRALLAEFAVDVLIGQAHAIDRWVNARFHARKRTRKERRDGVDSRRKGDRVRGR